jgi:hypothetical protein
LSSRNDFARSADKDSFDRSEPVLPKSELLAGAGGGEVTCERASPWLEGSTPIESLLRGSPLDNWCENGTSFFPRALRVARLTWPSPLATICIDGGVSSGAELDCEEATKFEPAASGFTGDCGGASRSGADLV